MESYYKNAVSIARSICMKKLKAGDRAVDATMGNGKDTAFLSNIVGKDGVVYSFDIQETAISNTKRILENCTEKNVVLVNDGHENMDKYVANNVQLIIFNLGYLPGGNHNITTKCKTTIEALEKALNLIARGGAVVISVYYGHLEGKREKKEIEAYVSELNQKIFNVLKICFMNQINDPPEVICIEKI